MRIGIDVRYLSHGLLGGVHTYVANFVPALIEQAPQHDIFLYADTKHPLEITRVPSNVAVRYLPWRNALSSVYQDLFLNRHMAKDRLDVAHFPANYGFGPAGARTIITVHDAMNLLPLRHIIQGLAKGNAKKTPRLLAMTVYLHFLTRSAVRRSDLLITDSTHARLAIARYGCYPLDKIVPVPLGLASDLRRIENTAILADVRHRHGLTFAFILADALKNPGLVVDAWRRLAPSVRATRRIVFFSRRPDPLPVVQEAVADGDAVLLIRPSRDDLLALYSMAEAFAFPSWLEGFGIPLLEAMRCGAPIVASDRGSIPEVVGDAGLLVDAEDSAAFARALGVILDQPSEGRRLQALGYARASDFSWQKTANRILECYEQVDVPARPLPMGGRL